MVKGNIIGTYIHTYTEVYPLREKFTIILMKNVSYMKIILANTLRWHLALS